MSRSDRAVRRVSHHLAPDEALIASALGLEVDGRRRLAVLLTDRRVLVAGLRGQPPVDLPRAGCVVSYERAGGLLTLSHGDQEIELRDLEEGAGRRIVALLARQGDPSTAAAESDSMRHVRVL